MKLNDGAVEAAALALADEVRKWPTDSSFPYDARVGVGATFQELAHVAVAAAMPHLTDDGATTPPADTGGVTPAAPESATPVGAGAAAPSSPHLEELAVVIRRHTLFPADEVETRETCACGWRPTGNPMLAYSEHACHVRDALVSAGSCGEGATPAIDRGSVSRELSQHRKIRRDPLLGGGWACSCGGWGAENWNDHLADSVLALIGQAQ